MQRWIGAGEEEMLLGEKTLFSLILPAYNEEKNLENAVRAAGKELEGADYEIIIAEDGSSDRTPEIAERLSKKFARVLWLHSDKKLGRGRALCNAFSQARGKFVAYMDVDLATNPGHLKQMLEELEKGTEVVVGSRYLHESNSKRAPIRLVLSKGFNSIVKIMLGSEISDHQCGFKGFRKSAALELCSLARDSHWFWDTEVLVLAQRKGMKIVELPVEWHEDRKGETKINFRRDVLEMAAAAVKMRLRGS